MNISYRCSCLSLGISISEIEQGRMAENDPLAKGGKKYGYNHSATSKVAVDVIVRSAKISNSKHDHS